MFDLTRLNEVDYGFNVFGVEYSPKLMPSEFWDRANPFAALGKPHRLTTFYGGRGSGKSYAVADAIAAWAADYRLGTVVCAREIQNSIRDSSYALLAERIEARNLTHRFRITNTEIESKNTGTRIIFKGLTTNIDSIKSMNNVCLVWIEEGQSIRKMSMEKLIPSVRGHDSARILVTMNPERSEDFMSQLCVEKPGPKDYAKLVNFYDNMHFGAALESDRQRALERIATAVDDADREQCVADYEWVWLGMYRRITSAQIFKRWVVKDFDDLPDYMCMYGVDFGFSESATAAVRCFVKDRDLYITHDCEQRHVENDDLSTFLARHIPGICAAVLRGDSARPETVAHLRRHGYPLAVGVEKWQGSVEDGIAHINGYNRIYVHPRCKATQQALKLYQFKINERSGDITTVPDKGKYDHIPDALRYALQPLIQRKSPGLMSLVQ